MNPPLHPFADAVFLTLYASTRKLNQKEICDMYEEGKRFCRRCYFFALILIAFFVVTLITWRVVPKVVNLPLIIWIVAFVSPVILICFRPAVGSIKLYLKLRRSIRYIRNELHGHTSEISLPAPFGTTQEPDGSGITAPNLEQCITMLTNAFQAHFYSKAGKVYSARDRGVALLDTGVSDLSSLLAHGRCFGLVDTDVTLEKLS